MWPGSPGPDPEARDPQFLVLEIITGQEKVFPHELVPPH